MCLLCCVLFTFVYSCLCAFCFVCVALLGAWFDDLRSLAPINTSLPVVIVIKCAKINPSDKVFSLIIVTKANAKGYVHGSWKKFYRRGHQRIFPKFFQEGPKVVKFVFSHLKLRKQTFLLKFFKSWGTKVPLLPFRSPWLCSWVQFGGGHGGRVPSLF